VAGAGPGAGGAGLGAARLEAAAEEEAAGVDLGYGNVRIGSVPGGPRGMRDQSPMKPHISQSVKSKCIYLGNHKN
jgi:hypothetical protein